MTAEQLFLNCAASKLRQLHSRIETCVNQLTDDQIWLRSGDNANACGNLCLHLAGNVRQWILHGVGGAPDTRTRDAEFAARGEVTKAELLEKLGSVVREACTVISSVNAARLTETIMPQNYNVTVLEAIFHVTEHFAQHTGQIILLTKAYTGADLGFYAHLSGTTNPPKPPSGAERP